MRRRKCDNFEATDRREEKRGEEGWLGQMKWQIGLGRGGGEQCGSWHPSGSEVELLEVGSKLKKKGFRG